MKNYKAPELEIVKFSHEDIITASSLPALVVDSSAASGEYNYEAADGAETKYGTFGQ